MIKIGTVFSGIGAPEQAFKNSGLDFSIEWACDIDKHCKETYFNNFSLKKWYSDIKDINPRELSDVDFYWYSFPCTDLSPEGRLDLSNGESALVKNALDILDEKEPPVMVFENVEGLLWPRFQSFYNYIKSEIEKKYFFHLYRLDAKNFGLPHSRPRVFGVGIRRDIGIKPDNFTYNYSTAHLQDILEENPADKFWLSQERTNKIIENTIKHQPDFKLENRLGEVKHTRSNSYRPQKKIRYDGISFCLTASAQHGIITPDHKIRHFTPRECARLLGFPDSFIPHRYDSYAFNQFGNSVAVPIVEQIIENIYGKSNF